MMPGIIAAGIDWLEGLLPLLFVGFWILSQVMALFRRVGGKRPEPVIVARPPEPERPLREELERQIEDFLRDVGGRRRQPRADIPPGPATPPRQPARERPPLVAAQPRVATPPSLAGLARRDTDVARHVHDAFTQELSHLESPLARGSIEQPSRPAAMTAGAELAALVRNPQTIRQMILLCEVLERPTDRW
jgi:hypothetical protein